MKNIVYNEDCMDVMRDMPDKSIDLCITDPPYGIGLKGKNIIKNKSDTKEFETKWDKAIPEEKFMRAAWLQFDEGYVPASCAASESLFKTQTEREVAKRVESLNLDGTNKNFSEDESGDMTAMRGAAGRTKGGKADYDMIDALIRSNQGITSVRALEEFRREGMLGEYK